MPEIQHTGGVPGGVPGDLPVDDPPPAQQPAEEPGETGEPELRAQALEAMRAFERAIARLSPGT
jgi:hypothetical protein